MALDKLVSINEAILEALEMMGKDDMYKAPMLNIWAQQAEKKIGSYYGLKKEICILDVDGCKAMLPCGTQDVIGVLLGDQGTDCDLIFDNLCQINVSSIDYTSLDTGIGLSIVGGHSEIKRTLRYELRGDGSIEFTYKPNDDKITVKILKHHVDSNGFLMVQECHVLAIAAYIKWKVAELSRWGPNKMTLSDIQYFASEWFVSCRDAIANSSWPSKSEQEAISGMINNPMAGNVFFVNQNIL